MDVVRALVRVHRLQVHDVPDQSRKLRSSFLGAKFLEYGRGFQHKEDSSVFYNDPKAHYRITLRDVEIWIRTRDTSPWQSGALHISSEPPRLATYFSNITELEKMLVNLQHFMF